MQATLGRIHSFESCGTVDGPGLRCVVFFQGCPLRCRYCHNPDTWNESGGKLVQAEAILARISRFKPYFGENGGITLSGGEPLLQPDFAAYILKYCQSEGIHTAVDTSGWVEPDALDKVLPHTDLLLLDVKALDNPSYQWLTGRTNDKYLAALTHIKTSGVDVWLRYVLLPGLNDTPEHAYKFKSVKEALGKQVKKVEIIPYHGLGVHKWQKLGLEYTLSSLRPPDQDLVARFTKECDSQPVVFSVP